MIVRLQSQSVSLSGSGSKLAVGRAIDPDCDPDPDTDPEMGMRGTMMKLIRTRCLFIVVLLFVASQPLLAQLAVKGKVIHTMTGSPLRDGVVLVHDGKISAIGGQASTPIPDGYQILEADVVTPGLIDAHTVVGLAGQYNYDHDQDQLERSDPIQPELRAIDAYNTHERLVAWVRRFGVTTIHTGHAPGELVSGQTMIAKTTGNTIDDAVMVPRAALAATLAQSAKKGEKKSPGTRSKMMSMLRQAFIDARAYQQKQKKADDEKKQPDRDLKKDVLTQVLAGELPLLITAHRAQDIANALRLAEEFDIRLILDGGAESYLLIDRIKALQVPVIIHPTMIRAYGETENMSFETASKLVAAGIPVALQSGYESYVPKTRIALFEAGFAAANGLSFEQALATITRDAATILGIDDRVGSLEVGKDGDLALFDGDPFEYTTHCIGVVIEGESLPREAL